MKLQAPSTKHQGNTKFQYSTIGNSILVFILHSGIPRLPTDVPKPFGTQAGLPLRTHFGGQAPIGGILRSGIWNLVLGTWILPFAFAQDVSFSASVSRGTIAMGDQLEVSFTLNGSSSGSDFRPPSLSEFLTLSGPNQSTNMQFINGAMSASISYSFILQPRSEGTFTIGPASIEAGGRKLKTQPVSIHVTKASPQARQQNPQQSDIGRQIGDNLFLKVAVDKSRVYQGDQVTATYKLYTRVNIVNYGITKAPSLTGFWSEDLDVPKQTQLSVETVGGKQYRVGVLKKVALFPQQSGRLTIDPMEVECVVQVQARNRSNDFFDQFFNDPFFGNVTNARHRIRSEPEPITVLPLPTSHIPPGFTGAVGRFTIDVWLDRMDVKTNEAITFKVRISGRGNLKFLEPPSVKFPPDLDRYDPRISDNITNQGDRIAGNRTFEYLLIPRHAGEQIIPSFPFSFFDAEKKSYVTLTSRELPFTVEQGSEVASGSTGFDREDIKLLGEDIRFIKSDNETLARRGDRFIGSGMFFVLSVTPAMAFIGFIVFVRKRENILADSVQWRSRQARKVARKRLAEARNLLGRKEKQAFFAEISRALWGYISDKLAVPPAELSQESVRGALELRGVPSDIIARLAETIQKCEFARFAPASHFSEMKTMYKETSSLISQIEDSLR